jgi:hypothetical protein
MKHRIKNKISNFFYTLLCAVIGKSPLRSKTRTENLNEIIISEIKKDRQRLLKELGNYHCRDMYDDVDVPIQLSDDWNVNIRRQAF